MSTNYWTADKLLYIFFFIHSCSEVERPKGRTAEVSSFGLLPAPQSLLVLPIEAESALKNLHFVLNTPACL